MPTDGSTLRADEGPLELPGVAEIAQELLRSVTSAAASYIPRLPGVGKLR
jgi:hypothetical protein